MTRRIFAASVRVFMAGLFSFFFQLQARSAEPAASEIPGEVMLERQTFPLRLAQTRYIQLRLPSQKLKEPPGLKGNVRRGIFELGKNTNNGVCLLWAPDEGKLYVDQNRNLDLTDDADGVYKASNKTGVQEFTNVVVPCKVGEDVHPLRVKLQLWNWRESQIQVMASMDSVWQGKAQFHGKSWQVGYMEGFLDWNPDGMDYLLIRPWEEKTNLVSTYNPTTGLMKFPRQLLWDGELLQARVKWATQNGASAPTLVWSAGEPVKMVQAKVTGEYQERFILSDTNRLTVLVSEPRKELKIPEGKYEVKGSLVRKSAALAFRIPYEPQSISVAAGTVLNVGGPLTNSVKFYRFGNLLRLEYWLAGADGGKYYLNNVARANPPTFAIYYHGVKIASGSFEFG